MSKRYSSGIDHTNEFDETQYDTFLHICGLLRAPRVTKVCILYTVGHPVTAGGTLAVPGVGAAVRA